MRKNCFQVIYKNVKISYEKEARFEFALKFTYLNKNYKFSSCFFKNEKKQRCILDINDEFYTYLILYKFKKIN